MSFTSWFTGHRHHRASAPTDTESQHRRQPVYARPSLECLEERALLDAATSAVGGSFQNLNLNNNFNFASNGNVLPIPGTSNFGSSGIANGADPQHALNFGGLASGGAGAEAASSSFLSQDQLYGQFRAFGVNSQGDGPQLRWLTTSFILRDAFGFGSGSQPNAPWKPNAYNLGLANHQFSYSSQTDMGFSAVPPWSRPIAQALPKNQTPFLERNEEMAEKNEQLPVQRALPEPEQSPREKQEQDVGDVDEELKTLMEQQASEKQSPLEAVVQEDGSLPDSLLLSALAPVPMASLVVGMQGMASADEGGEVSAEAGE